ncbi:MAG: dnaG 2 [Gammaproteobacteria bacterium]|jgi:hypothetical protein|nr:dnaG 2 [Gammaproteobacteria bacterium]
MENIHKKSQSLSMIGSLKNLKPNFKQKFFKNQLDRNLLPSPGEYYKKQGLKLTGGLEWKSALCPFHKDTNPSLRLRLDSGGFRCMACGVHGGDVISFHMQRYKLTFKDAVTALGAWKHE